MLGPVRAPASPPRDAHAEEVDAFLGALLTAAIGVLEVRVTRVDKQIARFEQGQLLVDHRVHDGGRRHQRHDDARLFEHRDELLDALGGGDGFARAFADECLALGQVAIITGDREAVIGQVQDQASAHDPQADHPEFVKLCGH